ncbi:MAG TPA: LuxR C-terminal-related transcriptional regulator, partial [Anaerolineales bacterium]|nr:LuxR C-terminal-related transcriptional regulator [Anaerolineales bacterium]
LSTSILNRLSGPLCDAVMGNATATGQETLEYLERANLFTVPLDNERRWYRYHHLFADLLQQRLHQQSQAHPTETSNEVNALHLRASQWYEENGLALEAFKHAAAAQDVTRAEALIEKGTLQLQFSGTSSVVLNWLASLPKHVLDERPTLWWRYAALLLVNGKTTGVEEKLLGAEAALAAHRSSGQTSDDKTRNLIGQIAAARATLALTQYDADAMIAHSHRALEYLHPQSLFTRSNAYWTLGSAYLLNGDRTAAREALTEAIALAKPVGAMFTMVLATIVYGNVQEADTQLSQAAQTYQLVLQWVGDQPQQIIHDPHLGLARIHYEWNDLETAQRHADQALRLARQYERHIDRFVLCEVFLARLKLAQGDVAGAEALLAQAARTSHEQKFVRRIPEVAAAQVFMYLRQGNLSAATHLTDKLPLPVSRARVFLAQGDVSGALTALASAREQAEANQWADERLRILALEAVAYQASGNQGRAIHHLEEALALAEPDGFIRLFVDEGTPMFRLVTEASARGIRPEYVAKLLAAFEAEAQKGEEKIFQPASQPLIEPLSQRELEVLHLIAQGLSNLEIGERLYLSENTVKGHNQKIFGKLHVQRRTEAVARARALGLL